MKRSMVGVVLCGLIVSSTAACGSSAGTTQTSASAPTADASFDAGKALAQLDGASTDESAVEPYQTALDTITEGCGGTDESNSDFALKSRDILKADGKPTDLLTIVQSVATSVDGTSTAIQCQDAFAAWVTLYESGN